MKKKEEYKLIKILSSIIFILLLNSINSFSFKALASNEDTLTTISYDNETINGNKTMMLPGSNMTFGSSLDNAKMHLIEAIMDIENNNINGALMQLI